MASFNRVILVGNLTRDVELRYTPSGTAVTEIGMAVNDRRKNQNGDWVEETTFVDVTLWGRTAQIASEYLGKGSPILVEGRLKLDTWETDGQRRSKLRVVGERMQMLGGGGGSRGGSRTAPPHYSDQPAQGMHASAPSPSVSAPAAQGTPTPPAGNAPPPEDDIPF